MYPAKIFEAARCHGNHMPDTCQFQRSAVQAFISFVRRFAAVALVLFPEKISQRFLQRPLENTSVHIDEPCKILYLVHCRDLRRLYPRAFRSYRLSRQRRISLPELVGAVHRKPESIAVSAVTPQVQRYLRHQILGTDDIEYVLVPGLAGVVIVLSCGYIGSRKGIRVEIFLCNGYPACAVFIYIVGHSVGSGG